MDSFNVFDTHADGSEAVAVHFASVFFDPCGSLRYSAQFCRHSLLTSPASAVAHSSSLGCVMRPPAPCLECAERLNLSGHG